MENTLENKEKFFALYLRTKTLALSPKTTKKVMVWDVSGVNEGDHLSLKRLVLLSDDDAKQIAIFQGVESELDKHYFAIGNEIIRRVFSDDLPKDEKLLLHFESADYLRFKGYALPWMGLSIQDLVLYGWIKLI